jgi:hypothetical protein
LIFVTPIRPQLPPTTPPARPASDARAAFFQAVKGAAATTPATAAQPQARRTLPTPAAIPVQATIEPNPPQRVLRPGSIVDIKV